MSTRRTSEGGSPTIPSRLPPETPDLHGAYPRLSAAEIETLSAHGERRFVAPGEVLLREFKVGGKESGETLALNEGQSAELRASLEWTFPLRFAEIISGDGRQVYRERIDLADTTCFGERTLTLQPRLQGRKWVRFEVWDVAANGAFTQPVWLEQAK